MDGYRFLYVNICEQDAYRGHKLFDAEYAAILSAIGDVDMIEPEAGWYQTDYNINVITYDPVPEINKITTDILNRMDRGIIHRFSPYRHLCNYKILSKVEQLDRQYHYTAIVAAHLDIFAYVLFRRKHSLADKLFVIEHMPSAYSSKYVRKVFNLTKNRAAHLVMEKAALGLYESQYRIRKDKLHYVPHPCNEIRINPGKKEYDIVGISNSNSSDFIDRLIELERKEGFFQKNGIRAIFRTRSEVFDNGWLKVIKGVLGLSFEEYYSCILNADLLVAPFDIGFGARTSGTIVDGLSNGVPVIGSPFVTMVQYSSEYPKACKVFRDLGEMCDLVIRYMQNAEAYRHDARCDFDNFKKERSAENIADIFAGIFSCDRIERDGE